MESNVIKLTSDEIKVYNQPCAKSTSPYGKFIKNYREHKLNKISKVQFLIDNDPNIKNQIANMSKYQFIKDFLLLKDDNDYVYSIKDFVTVKEWSFKGFLYESIWDIFFKCNLVVPYNYRINHMDGQIESLRDINSLEIIDNMYQYMNDNKIQSGSTGGVSDITLQFKKIDQIYQPICHEKSQDKSECFVFISSKFFKNEKAVSKYDTDVIKQAAKELNSDYDILLLVNDRRSLQEKMKRTLKKHIVESITKIYDVTDLEHYLEKFRTTIARLTLQSPNKKFDGIFKDYFSHSQKPLLPLTFPSQYFYAASQHSGLSKPMLFSSNFDHVLIGFYLTYLWNNTNKRVLMICNNRFKQRINDTRNRFYIVDQAKFNYCIDKLDKITTKDVLSYDTVFVLSENISKTLYKKIQSFCNVTPTILLNIYYNTHQLSNSNLFIYKNLSRYFYRSYSWYINDFLLLKHSNELQYQKILTDKYEPLLNETITSIYGNQYFDVDDRLLSNVYSNLSNQYSDIPDINIFTNKIDKIPNKYDAWAGPCLSDAFILGNFDSLISLIYGKENNLNQDFIFTKRLYRDNSPNTHVWLLPPKIIKECYDVFQGNTFVKKTYQFIIRSTDTKKTDLSQYEEAAFNNNKTLVLLTSSYKSIILPCLDTIFVFDDNAPATQIVHIISKIIHFKNKNYLNIIDFNVKRIDDLSNIIYPDKRRFIDPNANKN